MKWLSTVILVISVSCAALFGQKKVLDHDAYDIWNQIKEKDISPNGKWVMYVTGPEDGDNVLHIRNVEDDTYYSALRASGAEFSYNSRFAIAKISPAKETVKAAKKAKKKKDEMPKDSLLIVDLSDGSKTVINDVKSWRLPEKNGQWLAYLLEEMPEPKDTTAADSVKPEPKKEKKKEPKTDGKKDKKKKSDGNVLALRKLEDGSEWRYEHVTDYTIAKTGVTLAFATSSKDSSADGMFVVLTASGERIPVQTGAGDYKQIVLDESGEQLGFLSNRNDYAADQPAYALYYWSFDGDKPRNLATSGNAAFPENWWISEYGKLSFSKNGKRLFFGTAPKPAPEPEEKTPEDEDVNVDIWHWQDPELMTVQLANVEKDRKKSYLAMADIDKKRVVQLATESLPDIEIAAEGDADVAIGRTNVPYQLEISWDYPEYYDVYWLDLKKNTRQLVVEKLQSEAQISPAGNYLFWWNRADSSWQVYDVKRKQINNLTKQIPQAFFYEKHDWPYLPDSYGFAGWTEDDRQFLIYDQFDIWACDPAGKNSPVNVTDGIGRQRDLQLRYVKLDREAQFIPSDMPLLLSAFNQTDKSEGFFRDTLKGTSSPIELVMMPKNFSRPVKAKLDEQLLFTRESFQEFPDVWVSNANFSDMKQVSDVNPQQSEYNWGTIELINWRSLDGEQLNGLLIKPEDFDGSKKYPMLVYFYEKSSDNLNRHVAPAPHRSIINFTFYASRGYVIFVPDIPYETGYPGESAVEAVLPGVTHLIEQGFVDAENIGVQGHSWGGYQIAYLVTRTNIFKAAEAGAPVSNMFSAYGGIRWQTGLSRMFQYEHTQSRIGGTIWDYPLRYIENSPIFWVDKIQTPLLIMHNDHDGHVPWYQGIELFVALRRLGKPAWLINYNDEPHWPVKYHKKRDWQIRLQQYFDHFLKGAPAPEWLENGVPALEKGRNLGLEPVKK
ncbi:MAG: S9 family peptidase [Calditrichae bacterium]|nr:S9 family peptidase [Calditrichia bacterium]